MARARTKSASRWFDCAGHRDRDLHAAPRGQPQRIAQAVAGHEVGRDREHAVLGAEAGVDQQRVRGVLGLVGAAGQELREAAAGGGRRRPRWRAACVRAPRPSRGRTGVPRPRPRCPAGRRTGRARRPDARRCRVKYSPARLRPPDQSQPSSAIVSLRWLRRLRGPVRRRLKIGRNTATSAPASRSVSKCWRGSESAPKPSSSTRTLMPSRARRDEPVDHLVAERVVADDEGAHVDALARALDHLATAHRARRRRRHAGALSQRPGGARPKLSIRSAAQWPGRRRARRPRRAGGPQLALAEQQVHRQDEVGQQHEAHDPCDGRGGRALLAPRARASARRPAARK